LVQSPAKLVRFIVALGAASAGDNDASGGHSREARETE
jgi:hypothetical protein